MKALLVCSLIAAVAAFAWTVGGTAAQDRDPHVSTPVLVELFTSEACSSCPPADQLLGKLDQQPVPGADLIVLSEHVDYWNHIGWKDPHSDASFSARQSAYAHRFALDEVYTPQMVVDGTRQFVGSDSGEAAKAFDEARRATKIFMRISLAPGDGPGALRVRLETATLEPAFNVPQADVYLTLALKRTGSQVSSGENAGRKLNHVSVATDLQRVGIVTKGSSFAKDVRLKLEPGSNLHNLRVVAFVQETGQGRVLGAAMLPVTAD